MAKIGRYGAWAIAVILMLILIHMKEVPMFVQAEQSSNVKLNPPNSVIPASLFNLNVINLEYGVVWPLIPFESWRNTYADWSLLEPQKNEWNFESLDSDINLAQQSNVEVLLILKYTPTWASARPKEAGCCPPYAPSGNIAEPRNIEDWGNYIRTVATRYKGRVRYYELWNEPNVKRFYSGTVKQLISLNREAYQVLKEVDPSIKVVSSAMSPYGDHLGFFENYLFQGGGNYADVIGYHFYVAPKPPEAMLSLIWRVQALMRRYQLNDRPLWNTETGWKMINSDQNIDDEEWAGNPLSEEDSCAYVARSYILSWAAGVPRLYWYAWGHQSMGLTDYDGKTPKPVTTAYAEVEKWLVGAKMTSCQSDQEKTWVCQLKRDRGYQAWIVWNADQSLSFNLPQSWGVQQMRDLLGSNYSLSQANQVDISPSPLLLERLAK